MRQANWYVFTGGPSTGKSTILEKLSSQGFETVEEAARAVIDEQQANGVSVEQLRSDEGHFQELVFQAKITVESLLDEGSITFFDRGMQDTEAYMLANGLNPTVSMDAAMEDAMYAKVFLFEALPEFQKDYARTEDAETIQKLDTELETAYTKYGMDVVRVPAMSVKKRLEFIMSHVEQPKNDKLTYKDSGVNYADIDPAKVNAQEAAAATKGNLDYFGMKEISESRGESAYVWEEDDAHRAMVVEGLGTKSLAADAMYELTGKSYYDQVAQDTIAMIVNDLVVVGALPNVVNAYFALEDGEWMNDKQRSADLITGWARACDMAGAVWGGGETPALKGIIEKNTIDLAGAAVGIIKPKTRLVLGDELTAGDSVVLVESSGIHANGLTMARKIADRLDDGYMTKLSDGRTYGDALLTPTHIYVALVRGMLEAELDLHYMANITGHGWRKIMRANADFTYELDFVPDVPAEFEIIQKEAGVDLEEMYGNFNMGAGFAVFLPSDQAKDVIKIADSVGLKAWEAGTVKEGDKKVVIKPLDITFSEETLGVR